MGGTIELRKYKEDPNCINPTEDISIIKTKIIGVSRAKFGSNILLDNGSSIHVAEWKNTVLKLLGDG
jgi:hypothetical protein